MLGLPLHCQTPPLKSRYCSMRQPPSKTAMSEAISITSSVVFMMSVTLLWLRIWDAVLPSYSAERLSPSVSLLMI